MANSQGRGRSRAPKQLDLVDRLAREQGFDTSDYEHAGPCESVDENFNAWRLKKDAACREESGVTGLENLSAQASQEATQAPTTSEQERSLLSTGINTREPAASASPQLVKAPVTSTATPTLNTAQSSQTRTVSTQGLPTMPPQGDSQRVVHQDYIVRTRYSNALPPVPDGPPKLLEIPSPGIGPYTMPHYASRMARNQPINIEADGFLGMDINLVGMPGVFDGDESSIQAPLVPPPVHPKDRSLLRPLKSLGKPKGEVADVSFLRRNQFIAEDRSRLEQGGSRQPSTSVKRRVTQFKSKEDRDSIVRSAIKGFDIANPETAYKGPDTEDRMRGQTPTAAELEAWNNPVHPTDPNLKPVAFYPVLPDLDAFTDDQGYSVYKFSGNPVDAKDGPDPRMENALLHPLDPSPKDFADYQAKLAAHKADPKKNPHPGPPAYPYELFLPSDVETARKMKAKFDVDNPDKDSQSLYTYASEPDGEKDSYRYTHTRIYDPGLQVNLQETPYQEVAIALHDPALEKKRAELEGREAPAESGRLQKGAYYYPIRNKVQLKPRRTVQMEVGMPAKQEEQETIDNLDVTIREPDEEELARRGAYRDAVDPKEKGGQDGAEDIDGEEA